MKTLLTLEEVAQRAGIATITMYRWVKRGWAPVYRRLPSGEFRFLESDVEVWLQGMVVRPDSSSATKGQAPQD